MFLLKVCPYSIFVQKFNIENMYLISISKVQYFCLSYDVASGSEITSCNKIGKPLVVYRFTGNVMTSIPKLRT